MEAPLEITFRNMNPSEAVEAKVRERAQKLERYYDRITSCHVAVEAPHRQHRRGNHYHVRIEVRVPGTELVVSRDPGDLDAHEDVYVAVRDSFNAMERQLEDFARRQRGEVKSHDAPLQGTVARLFPEQDYGFIATTDGREIYFHRNSVINEGFDALQPGSPVQLVLVDGESPHGPQATTVRPITQSKLVS